MTREADPGSRGRRGGLLGAVERSWSGEAGTIPWTRVLIPLAAGYAFGSGWSRRRAAQRRRTVPGLHVVAVGNLTVGGTGKSSLARWLALEILAAGGRPVIVLRGHGAPGPRPGTTILPDFAGYPVARAFERGGDEAAAHRAALPLGATVAVGRDRRRAAQAAHRGYGATAAILDDGWEQDSLAWDELWVALDPSRPVGSGALLPAGPLRRPARTLSEASVVAFVLEDGGEDVSADTLTWTRKLAPQAIALRFRRTLSGTSKPGSPAVEPWNPDAGPAALISAVGSPARLTRFAEGAGIRLVSHVAFPDHAAWSSADLAALTRRGAASGARLVLITEKDEPRWPSDVESPIPVRVLRTRLVAIDPVDGALARLRAAVAAPPRMG